MKHKIKRIIDRAANNLARGCWWEERPSDEHLPQGWIVGAIFDRDLGADYTARKLFADWWAPGTWRNDGLRTAETADEKGRRLGRAATVAALRTFSSTLQEA